MRGRVVVLASVALLVVGAVQTDLARIPQRLLAPAYDVVTQVSLRNLAVALQSRAMVEGGLEDVTVAELGGWGWEPTGTTAVTIWVAGEHFRAVAEDVRPGATTFEITATDDGIVSRRLPAEPTDPPAPGPEPGVRILSGSLSPAGRAP